MKLCPDHKSCAKLSCPRCQSERFRPSAQPHDTAPRLRCYCGTEVGNWAMHKAWHRAKGGGRGWDYALYTRLLAR